MSLGVDSSIDITADNFGANREQKYDSGDGEWTWKAEAPSSINMANHEVTPKSRTRSTLMMQSGQSAANQLIR